MVFCHLFLLNYPFLHPEAVLLHFSITNDCNLTFTLLKLSPATLKVQQSDGKNNEGNLWEFPQIIYFQNHQYYRCRLFVPQLKSQLNKQTNKPPNFNTIRQLDYNKKPEKYVTAEETIESYQNFCKIMWRFTKSADVINKQAHSTSKLTYKTYFWNIPVFAAIFHFIVDPPCTISSVH